MARELIVVDVETTGLGDGVAIVEVAAVNVETGEEFSFVPVLDDDDLTVDALFALKLNGYIERELWRQQLSPNDTRLAYSRLDAMLQGNTFAGSNPAFDSKLIARRHTPTWHHRLADLAAYAAGKLDIDPTDLPGLDAVVAVLGLAVPSGARHSALGDALLTAECFRKLREIKR